jgi:hypothetical protein
MYNMKLACVNCHHKQTHKLTKGITLELWLEDKPKCTFCDCKDTLQSVYEYALRKKMFEDFINNEHNHEHDHSDTSSHQHYA